MTRQCRAHRETEGWGVTVNFLVNGQSDDQYPGAMIGLTYHIYLANGNLYG